MLRKPLWISTNHAFIWRSIGTWTWFRGEWDPGGVTRSWERVHGDTAYSPVTSHRVVLAMFPLRLDTFGREQMTLRNQTKGEIGGKSVSRDLRTFLILWGEILACENTLLCLTTTTTAIKQEIQIQTTTTNTSWLVSSAHLLSLLVVSLRVALHLKRCRQVINLSRAGGKTKQVFSLRGLLGRNPAHLNHRWRKEHCVLRISSPAGSQLSACSSRSC